MQAPFINSQLIFYSLTFQVIKVTWVKLKEKHWKIITPLQPLNSLNISVYSQLDLRYLYENLGIIWSEFSFS